VLRTLPGRTLVLGLVRWLAPASCGLMVFLLGGATWYCGHTSARWRRELAAEHP
jgi:hypothetical protein